MNPKKEYIATVNSSPEAHGSASAPLWTNYQTDPRVVIR